MTLGSQKSLEQDFFPEHPEQSLEAAEERARTDLGMIGPSETFYQVVPVADAAR